MTLVLDVRNVFVLAQQMFWRWFLGMGAKPIRLPLHLVLKTVLDANDVNLLAQPTFSVCGST